MTAEKTGDGKGRESKDFRGVSVFGFLCFRVLVFLSVRVSGIRVLVL